MFGRQRVGLAGGDAEVVFSFFTDDFGSAVEAGAAEGLAAG
jgi:hypothetical protein